MSTSSPKRENIIRTELFLLSIIIFLCSAGNASACTLWGSIGSANRTRDETIIAKNRDWRPNQTQILKIVKPVNGYAYLGLYVQGEPGLKAGINKKGLVIISASAGSIPHKERKRATGKKGIMRQILSTYSSVDDIVNDQKIFSQARPVILMIADKNTILCVEIGLNGNYFLTKRTDGTIGHTNHFLSPTLVADNRKVGESSRKRLEKIQDLLAGSPAGWSLTEHIRISEDQSAGPRNSIMRTGAHQDDERTLATWIAVVPKGGTPMIYTKLRNPGESDKVYRYQTDDTFWKQVALPP
jgi:isopenicillin-N N-acyltransferase like protein